jgi:RimJ/RimL family protein N-acetyltransferase
MRSKQPAQASVTLAKASPIVDRSDGGTLVAWASCARSSRRICRSSTSTSATGKRRRWLRSAARTRRVDGALGEDARERLGLTWTVVSDGAVAGNIGCWEDDGRRLVGYWIGREFWGRGLATQALAELLDVVDARPLHAYVAKSNVASIRVLEKCGFVKVGEHAGDDGIEELLLELPA